MKLISWNVNWIRACLKKWFLDYLKEENPDVIGLQETKWRIEQAPEADIKAIEELWYKIYWNPAERPGYSGTAVFSKIEPLNVIKWIETEGLNLNEEELDEVIMENHEWRVITLEFENFFYTTVYTPNSKRELERLPYREIWDEVFLKYMKKLEETKPVIFCGDLNVAHKEIDLKNPKPNMTTEKRPWNAGFTDQERTWFDNMLEGWFIDTFRKFYPEEEWHYTWWSNFAKSRERNIGWRIDYFMISNSLENKLESAFIRPETMWSDHCPVWVVIK